MRKFYKKFSLAERPGEEMPELPRELDVLSDADLMSLYSEFVAWTNYAHAELVLAELEEEESQTNLSFLEQTKLAELGGTAAKGERVTALKAKRDADTEVSDARIEHFNKRAYRKLVQTVFDRCERSANLMSRELSRRISMNPRDRSQRFAP
jgi:L-lactate utilization protein LutC